jgi:hypothetical protein
MAKKSWNEKLNDSKKMPYVQEVPPEAAIRFGGPKMLLAPPLAYDAIMKQVPQGKLITTDRIREFLAAKHNADFTCPLCTGIFVNIVANASAERMGKQETPYWRTLKKDGELCEKFPGGIVGHKKLLEMEGHKVIQKGKKSIVADFGKSLFDLGAADRDGA